VPTRATLPGVRLSRLIFDLDNTLYPPERGVVDRVHVLITSFMVERLGMTADDADVLRARYREELGTTLNGLMRDYAISPDEYLTHVHAIEIEQLLCPDPALLAMLQALPHEKIVFTNGSAAHAERVLACLGVRECFDDVFSLERVDYVPKPQRAAFESVLRAIACAPEECLLIDDRVDNLITAHALGMRTLLVGSAAAPAASGIELAVSSILELAGALRAVSMA
jgi:putative hydrolase of the HAD superfamily